MGERCLRWAMNLPAHAPLTPDGGPLSRAGAQLLFENWMRRRILERSRTLLHIVDELMVLDDVHDLRRITPGRLSRMTGHSHVTINNALRRLEALGGRLMEALTLGGSLSDVDKVAARASTWVRPSGPM